MNAEGKVLLQKRVETKMKNRGMWDKTAGGHVNSEETVEQAIQREVNEELGITIPKNQINIVDIYKNNQERYFGYNFIFVVDYKIEHFILQREEVSDIKFFDIEELEEIKLGKNKNYTFIHWNSGDFEKEMGMLKKYREKVESK